MNNPFHRLFKLAAFGYPFHKAMGGQYAFKLVS